LLIFISAELFAPSGFPYQLFALQRLNLLLEKRNWTERVFWTRVWPLCLQQV